MLAVPMDDRLYGLLKLKRQGSSDSIAASPTKGLILKRLFKCLFTQKPSVINRAEANASSVYGFDKGESLAAIGKKSLAVAVIVSGKAEALPFVNVDAVGHLTGLDSMIKR